MGEVNYKRDHVYLDDDRYNNPKECFKELADFLSIASQDETKKLLDVGCATGEFLFYLRSINKQIQLYGIDYSAPLIERGSEKLKGYKITLDTGDATNLAKVKDEAFDFVTTIGVTSIFDDFKPSYDEMIRVAKNGGTCINFMLVNEENVDVFIKYRNAKTGELQSGWNKFSKQNISKYLNSHNKVGNVKFVKQHMPFDIMRREDDLVRSWTKLDSDGKRIFWNGLNMEISLYYIIFKIIK